MRVIKTETLPIGDENDIVRVRQAVRRWAVDLRYTLTNQTKIVTAASEIARNTLTHGFGGTFVMNIVTHDERDGIRMNFSDKGPGISDIDLALHDGYTTGSGLGLGLGGSKRLIDEFEIFSELEKGTRVTLVHWK